MKVLSRMNRVWSVGKGINYIRFYPNPGFRLGTFFFSKKDGFRRLRRRKDGTVR